MSKITKGQVQNDLGGNPLRKQRAGGGGTDFPLRLAKVTRVDAKKMTVGLYCLTGEGDDYDNVSLTQAAAGARHFIGAIPQVNDLCVIGFAQAESGYSRTPYIIGWIVPGTEVGYDWVTTSPTNQDELRLTPALREAVKGSFGRRRHKLRQMEEGNIVASSAQGADLLLNESATLVNRRGNEVVLRDQDQALVTRSLQHFGAQAGVRTYSGMVQRDATLLPTQMFTDRKDWYGPKQVGSDGKALFSAKLENSTQRGVLSPNEVFSATDAEGRPLAMAYTDPTQILTRGLFIDNDGRIYDDLVTPTGVYGGKPLHRVSVDGTNGVLDQGTRVFSEFRIEVSHTADGTLPVTEQTDGIDIDRLLPNAPNLGVDGTGDPNPLNKSPNAMMAELVLGTAVGNDPINDRASYGLPLVPSLYDKNGQFSPGLRAADNGTPVTEHAAFLIRVKNPTDPKAVDAFMAITKGGAYRSYFPGAGSKSHEEYYQTGKRIALGQDIDGQSIWTEGDGTISFRNTGKGRPSDNIGVELRSEGGAIELFAGGPTSAGGGTPSADPNLTPAGTQMGLLLRSAKSTLVEAVDRIKIAAQTVETNDADVIAETANTAINMNSGDVISMSSKTLGVTINGKAEYTYGGPKNGLPTNGPSRTTKFTSTPLTGNVGGTVDDYEMVYGNRTELFRLGRHTTNINVGSFNVNTMAPALPSVGPGAGVKLSTGLPGIDNKLVLNPVTGAKLSANSPGGTATLQSTKGQAVVRGTLGVAIQSPVSVGITAPSITVRTPTPFIGGVLTDGCINPLTGRTFLLSGTVGVATFRVGV
jgi:hypothetical protein